MKSAVVTGANGFVGSRFVQELLENGYYVYAVVRNEKSDMTRLAGNQNLSVLFCDLSNINSLQIKDKNIDCFIHFAWSGTAGNARANYDLQLQNVKFSCDALHTAARLGAKRFIYAGSIMEYEVKQQQSIDGARLGRSLIYSTAKLTADYMMKVEAAAIGIDYISYIISNIYGEGEYSERFINTTIRKMLRKERLAFTSGEQLYDFIHVSDAVRAMRIVAEEGIPFTEYYIGNEKVIPLKEYIIRIKNVIDPSAQLYLGEIESNSEMFDYHNIQTDRLLREFHFHPKMSFEDGIRITGEWIAYYDKI